MKILGLFGGYYNPAACLVVDGRLVAFIEEEKLTRKKGERDIFPLRAVQYVLKEGGLRMRDVDRIAFPWSKYANVTSLPWIGVKELARSACARLGGRIERPDHVPSRVPNGLSNVMTVLNGTPIENQRRILATLRYGGILDPLPAITFVPHHESHAASVFYASGFERSVILVMDGMGDDLATSIWLGEGTSLRCIDRVKFPNSLGEYYSAFTEFLGFKPYSGEGKLMGLAAYGQRDESLIRKIADNVLTVGDGGYRVNTFYTFNGDHNYGERYTDAMVALFGAPREREAEITDEQFNLAHAAQYLLEEAAIRYVRPHLERLGIRDFCISGGVAMNCKMNGRLHEALPVDRVFINPASNDAGSAMGAALRLSALAGQDPRFDMQHAYWGPGFGSDRVEACLKEAKVRYRRSDDVAEDVSAYLEQEKIVGWHQGRMEVGARALGARSILASPLKREMLDKVNREVKHREPWRPFAPAMIEDVAAEFYAGGAPSPFMILAFEVLAAKREVIPAVTHVDRSCRPQTVRREHHARYYDLIAAFGRRTGVPVVLNTSFNVRGEPIVCTPEDSLRCFFSTGLDVLAIEDFIVTKEG